MPTLSGTELTKATMKELNELKAKKINAVGLAKARTLIWNSLRLSCLLLHSVYYYRTSSELPKVDDNSNYVHLMISKLDHKFSSLPLQAIQRAEFDRLLLSAGTLKVANSKASLSTKLLSRGGVMPEVDNRRIVTTAIDDPTAGEVSEMIILYENLASLAGHTFPAIVPFIPCDKRFSPCTQKGEYVQQCNLKGLIFKASEKEFSKNDIDTESLYDPNDDDDVDSSDDSEDGDDASDGDNDSNGDDDNDSKWLENYNSKPAYVKKRVLKELPPSTVFRFCLAGLHGAVFFAHHLYELYESF